MPLKLSSLRAADTAELTILDEDDSPTEWVVTIAGPNHPRVRELSDAITKRALKETRDREIGMSRGRNYKPPERTPDDLRKEDAEFIAEHIVDWRGLAGDDGTDLPFTKQAAIGIVSDPALGHVRNQISRFIGEITNFMKGSPKA